MSCLPLPSTLLARDGLALHVSQWPVSRPRGVVQLIHSLCEHSGRYAEVATALNDEGWAVVAIDLRGHGLSSGPRGGLAQDDDLLHDQAALYDATTQAGSGGHTRVLLGIGIGGLVAARMVAALARDQEEAGWVRHFDGLMLVAPALQPHMSFTQRALLSAFGRLVPDLAVPVGLKREWLNSDLQEQVAAQKDPLIHDSVTSRLTHFLHDAGQYVHSRVAGWGTPTLMLYSRADRLVHPASCERFASALQAELVSARDYQAMAHDLLHEPERAQVHTAMNQWLAERFPAAANSHGFGVMRGTGS